MDHRFKNSNERKIYVSVTLISLVALVLSILVTASQATGLRAQLSQIAATEGEISVEVENAKQLVTALGDCKEALGSLQLASERYHTAAVGWSDQLQVIKNYGNFAASSSSLYFLPQIAAEGDSALEAAKSAGCETVEIIASTPAPANPQQGSDTDLVNDWSALVETCNDKLDAASTIEVYDPAGNSHAAASIQGGFHAPFINCVGDVLSEKTGKCENNDPNTCLAAAIEQEVASLGFLPIRISFNGLDVVHNVFDDGHIATVVYALAKG